MLTKINTGLHIFSAVRGVEKIENTTAFKGYSNKSLTIIGFSSKCTLVQALFSATPSVMLS